MSNPKKRHYEGSFAEFEGLTAQFPLEDLLAVLPDEAGESWKVRSRDRKRGAAKRTGVARRKRHEPEREGW